jgi:hypothetical protein
MDFDKNKYKVWRLPHPILIHWVLNPALAFNELILGQRLPKITLIDRTSDSPLMERQFVPCPHCGTVHNGLLWAKQGAFMNWFGYLCPKCEQIIPCLWNLTSLVLLTISFPIWGWFRRPLESKWRKFKKNQLIKNKHVEPVTAKNTSWLKMGLLFGLLMFCMMLLAQLIDRDITSTTLTTQFLICLAAGLAFGGMMKILLSLKNNII